MCGSKPKPKINLIILATVCVLYNYPCMVFVPDCVKLNNCKTRINFVRIYIIGIIILLALFLP